MRRDGKKAKNVNLEYLVSPHIMPQRNDALNMIELDIPYKPIQDYLNAKRKEGKNISHLAVFIAAYSRIIGEFPCLNRFIVNKTVYDRNELAVGMVVLKNGQMDNGTTSKTYFDPTDTIFEVNDKMNAYIESNRDGETENATDKLVKVLVSVPGLLRLGVCAFKVLDKFGLLPRAIIDASPFHASMLISNLASIRTNHIFHHIYNFGTIGVLITLGNSRDVAKTDKEGNVYLEKSIPMGVVMDERICSGSYFALAFRKFKKYLKNPELLETAPDPKQVIRPIPYRKDRMK